MKLKLLIILALISVSSLLFSTTWHIKLDGTGDFTTIQQGINASTNSDTVLVYPGTYFENVNFFGKDLTIASLELITGDDQYITHTIIDGQQLESCVRVHNGETNAVLRGFTVQNGYGSLFWSEDGGGILVHNNSTINVVNCIVKNNIACLGAGVYARESTINLSGVSIINNAGNFGGAIYAADDSHINFDPNNLCNIYNNNAAKGAEIYAEDTYPVNVIVDTFTVFNPDRFFAEFLDGASFTFNIQNNWMELESNDLYVSPNGDNTNSGLTLDDPLQDISFAVRKIQPDEQNPLTIHLAPGLYSNEENNQTFPIGCKENLSIIGSGMDATLVYNDLSVNALAAYNLSGSIEISDFSIRNDPDIATTCVVYLVEIDLVKMKNVKIKDNSNIKKVIHTEFIVNEFENLIIRDNIASSNAGLGLEENSGYMKNCIITNNEAIDSGWGSEVIFQLDAYEDEPFIVENCIFSNNIINGNFSRIIRVVSGWGEESPVKFINCKFINNYTNFETMMHVSNRGVTDFINCTFANNSASETTLKGYGDINLTNTIFDNPTQFEVFMADYVYVSGEISILNIDYSNIVGGQNSVYNQGSVNTINWNYGNIDMNPLFTTSYELTEFSPCIDAGTPDTSNLFLPPWDLIYNQRIWDGDDDGFAVIDMGCYEFGADSLGISNHQLPMTSSQMTNYPNPFNPSTTISFNVPQTSSFATIEIYNLKGQKVKTLPVTLSLSTQLRTSLVEESGVNQLKVLRPSTQLRMTQAGNKEYSVVWNGTDQNNKPVSSGIYFAKLKAGKIEANCKMLLLK